MNLSCFWVFAAELSISSMEMPLLSLSILQGSPISSVLQSAMLSVFGLTSFVVASSSSVSSLIGSGVGVLTLNKAKDMK